MFGKIKSPGDANKRESAGFERSTGWSSTILKFSED